MVFDDTIANNISMEWDRSLDAQTRARIEQAARNSYCADFIERLPEGYNTRVGERGLKLSGGQRQRLAIARELFKQPDILILDEATSSLDSQSESYIQQSMERLRGALTIIIISHRLSTIRHVDYIYVIEQGRIIEHGTFSELSGLQGSVSTDVRASACGIVAVEFDAKAQLIPTKEIHDSLGEVNGV